MTTAQLKIVIPILIDQGVIKAALFGSSVKSNFSKKSSIDFLVKLSKNKSLLDLIGLKLELEDRLGRKVNVVSYNGINPLLKDRILKEQKVIYETKKRS